MNNTSLPKSLENAFTSLENNKLDTSNVLNNLTTTAAGYALDARQGKILAEMIKSFQVNYITSGTVTLSDYKEAGIYCFSTNVTVTDIPIGGNGWLIVLPYTGSTSTTVKQIWTRWGTATTNSFQTYERLVTATAVGEWRRFATYDLDSNMTSNRAVYYNGNHLVTTDVTNTQLGYLSGVTSNIQTQLNSKAGSTHNHDDTYVNKTGDTMSGALTVSPASSHANIYVKTSDHQGALTSNATSGDFGLYSNTKSKWLIKCGTDGVVSLGATTFTGTVTVKTTGSSSVTASTDLHEARMVSNSNGNFGLYDDTFAKWLIMCNSSGVTSMPATTFSGANTFSGTNNFSKTTTFDGACEFNGSNTFNGYIHMQTSMGFEDINSGIHMYGGSISALTSNATTLLLGNPSTASGLTTSVRGNTVRIYAHTSGAVYLGVSGSTAITSDENLKNIYDIDEKYEAFFDNLVPVTYTYKQNGHRKHLGFGARAVETALLEAGLTTEEFAGIIIDKDVTISADENGTDKDIHYDELYSLRYEEFIAMNTNEIQKLKKRVEILEEKDRQNEILIEKLMEQVSLLQKQVSDLATNLK